MKTLRAALELSLTPEQLLLEEREVFTPFPSSCSPKHVAAHRGTGLALRRAGLPAALRAAPCWPHAHAHDPWSQAPMVGAAFGGARTLHATRPQRVAQPASAGSHPMRDFAGCLLGGEASVAAHAACA